ncbi:hypothetical protein Pr1d_25950 [Bythopirellula goksoeyrii]|uniref:Uncharacterized protein n=1 Tax=Bythopirellula goksoeyrii TaxID=1400387 RepID=A0A5B9QBY2_9BACT|nr:hypothetical protein Pr1d_25950 [Bythopirellula goksoeyrii]
MFLFDGLFFLTIMLSLPCLLTRFSQSCGDADKGFNSSLCLHVSARGIYGLGRTSGRALFQYQGMFRL